MSRLLEKKAAPLHEEAKDRMFYHGTSSEVRAQSILSQGIQPREISMPDKAKSKTQLAPAQGRVYVTSELKYAAIYALGGDVFGHTFPEGFMNDRDGNPSPYGFIFAIKGSDIQGDVVPDEDSIGEFITHLKGYLISARRLELFNAGVPEKWSGERASAEHSIEYHGKSPINKPEAESVANQLYTIADRVMTDRQRRDIVVGMVGAQAAVGKKVQKYLTPDLVKWMLDHGAHTAHLGAIYPTKAWRFLKTDAAKIKAEDVLSICEEIPVQQHKAAASAPPTFTPAREIRRGDMLVGKPTFQVRNVLREGDEVVVLGGPGVVRRFELNDEVHVRRKVAAQHRYYHGSRKQFGVGTLLKPQKDGYAQSRDQDILRTEQIVEQYRPANAIPRNESVFLADNQYSCEKLGGYGEFVYEVEPIGEVQRSCFDFYSEIETYIWDNPNDPEAKELAEGYWSGETPANHNAYEYRCRSARVLRQLTPEEIENGDENSSAKTASTTTTLYHVTFLNRLNGIAEEGLVPGSRRSIGAPSLDGHAAGRVFLTKADGVDFWLSRADMFANHDSDNPVEEGYIPVVLRVKAPTKGLISDTPGTDDAAADAFYTTNRIDPSKIEFWHGNGWSRLMGTVISSDDYASIYQEVGSEIDPEGGLDPNSPLSRPKLAAAKMRTVYVAAAYNEDAWQNAESNYRGGFDEKATDEENKQRHYRGNEWQQSALAALSLGKITPQEAKQRKWHFMDTRPEDFKPLPEKLYHVTTSADNVFYNGIMSRWEQSMGGGRGLGGGSDKSISFTTDYLIAQQIYDAMYLGQKAASGAVTETDMIKWATEGVGAPRPYLEDFKKGLKSLIGGDDPFGKLTSGMKYERTMGNPPKDGEGWEPDTDGYHWTGGDGVERYGVYKRKFTPTEAQEARWQAFKSWIWAREQAGGSIDPLFFTTDTAALAKVDPEEIAIIEFKPVPGAMGVQVSGLGEWRTFSGKAVKVVGVVPYQGKKIAAKTADGPTQNQDHMGKPGDITESPAFKAWFQGSKVVDAHGRPLRMYHGTSKDTDFSAFRNNKNGIWFTDSPSEASMYAENNDSQGMKYEGGRYTRTNTRARVMPVYLRITKPYTWTPEDNDAIKFVENYKRFQAQRFDKLRSEGYDGIDLGKGIWVVLGSQSQIKSAIGNNGSFHPEKSNITAAVVEPVAEDLTESPAFKAWFAGSKAVDDHGRPLRVYHGTNADFDTFDPDKGERSSEKAMDNIPGVSWFAANPDAGTYFGGWRDGAQVMPVYLSIKNPLVVDLADMPEVRGEFFNIGKRKVYDIRYIKGRSIQQAKDDGNDGVIFLNGYDGTPASGNIFAVFSANQIKSAIGNNGKFDPQSNSITASVRGVQLNVRAYHGTPKGGFTEFKSHKFHGIAGFFASDPGVSDICTRDVASADWDYSEGCQIYPVQLHLKKAADFRPAGGHEQRYLLPDFAKLVGLTEDQVRRVEQDGKYAAHKQWPQPAWAYAGMSGVIEALKSGGYDGIVYMEPAETGDVESYVVFDNASIESGFGKTASGKVAKQIGPVYHGAHTWYDTIQNNQYHIGRFFSSSPDVAKMYGPKVFKAYITINKPFTVNAKGEDYSSIPTPKAMRSEYIRDTVDADNIAEFAFKNGYDGAIIKNVFEGNGVSEWADDYIVFSPSQIKVVAEADVKKSPYGGEYGLRDVGEWRDFQGGGEAKTAASKQITREQAIQMLRSADEQGKNKDSDHHDDFKYMRPGPYVLVDMPLDDLDYISQTPDREAFYAAVPGKFPPVYGVFTQHSLRNRLEDGDPLKVPVPNGNHRCCAAELRGDKTVPTIMQQAQYDFFMDAKREHGQPKVASEDYPLGTIIRATSGGAFDKRTLALVHTFDGWHQIEDFGWQGDKLRGNVGAAVTLDGLTINGVIAPGIQGDHISNVFQLAALPPGSAVSYPFQDAERTATKQEDGKWLVGGDDKEVEYYHFSPDTFDIRVKKTASIDPDITVYRGVDVNGAKEMRPSEEGVYGPGVYFYDNPLDARAYAGVGGGILVGTVPGGAVQVKGKVIVLSDPRQFTQTGFVPTDKTLSIADMNAALAKTAAATTDQLPPEPGTAPIPPGTIRLFHYTRTIEAAESIERQGLLKSHGRGDDNSYGGPSAGVWASTQVPRGEDIKDKPAYIEFWARPEEISHNADYPDKRWNPGQIQEWVKGLHHVIMRGDVPPDHIVAMHLYWQPSARYLIKNRTWERDPDLFTDEEISSIERHSRGDAEALRWVRDHYLKGKTATTETAEKIKVEPIDLSGLPGKEAAISTQDHVLYHGSNSSDEFDAVKTNHNGIIWLAEEDAAGRYSRIHYKNGPSRLYEVRLKPNTRIVDLRDLSDPIVREFKGIIDGIRKMGFGSFTDEEWPRFADFGLLERYEWAVKWFRSKKVDGVVVKDAAGAHDHDSLALLNPRAIQSQSVVTKESSLNMGDEDAVMETVDLRELPKKTSRLLEPRK